MLAHLRDKGDRTLCGTLLEELRAAHPDLYAQSAPYYLEWQIADALAAVSRTLAGGSGYARGAKGVASG